MLDIEFNKAVPFIDSIKLASALSTSVASFFIALFASSATLYNSLPTLILGAIASFK